MKISEFDDHAQPQGAGDASSWKSRTSPYPRFDKKKTATDGGEGVSSANSFGERTSPAHPQHGVQSTPLPGQTSASAARVGNIKILEFNSGPDSSLVKVTAPSVHAEKNMGLNARTIKPESSNEKAGVKTPIKIVEFGNDSGSEAPSSAGLNRTGIKIVEYGEQKAKGK
jgi:hypothetical protein